MMILMKVMIVMMLMISYKGRRARMLGGYFDLLTYELGSLLVS